MKTYNKLVRDKIPEIVKNNGGEPKTRILNESEYLDELNKKLQEEVTEYLESGAVEELADIEEVLRAILKAKKVEQNDFENIRLSKVQKRGAFDDKIFLESVDE